MSKMGRYVFDLQMAEEAEFYGHPDRKARTNPQADKDTGPAAGRDGDRRLFCGTHQRERADGGQSTPTADLPMATGPTPCEILRRS